MSKCRHCSAEITTEEKFCPFCGGADPISVAAPMASSAPPPADAQPGAPRSKGAGEQGYGRDVKTFSCNSCGATVSFDPAMRSLTCAYCGSQTVIEQTGNDKLPRPQRVIPFAFARDKAEQLFWKWLGKGIFRPGDLKGKSAIADLRGVYMPFWAFDADANSQWSADAGYYYDVQEPYTAKDSTGKATTQTRSVRHTRWEPATGRHSAHYEDLLVTASRGLDQDWVNRIAPFSTEKARLYNPDYLAGFAAENAGIEANEAMKTAEKLVRGKEEEECGKMVPGDTHRELRVNSTFTNWAYDLALLPLWIAAYKYRDKTYRFLVNGETGEVQGVAPVSWLRVTVAAIIGLGIIGAIAAVVAMNS